MDKEHKSYWWNNKILPKRLKEQELQRLKQKEYARNARE